MSRYATTIVIEELVWIEVSLAQPCQICGAVSGCTTMENGEFAHCSQTVSEWPVLDGGWLHRLAVDGVQTDALSPA